MSSGDPESNGNVPRHVAVIMDGNGRWAEARGLSRIDGHKQGVKSVLDVVETAAERGVEYLTLYTFSTENWKRPLKEVNALMSLLIESIRSYTDLLMNKDVRLHAIGSLDQLSLPVRTVLNSIIKKTSSNKKINVILALNYGGRQEILDGVKKIAGDVASGKLTVSDIDEEAFSNSLYTANFPDPELMVRTSGEFRLSNFLLWQLSYAEFYVTDTYWPDFGKEEFIKALESFKGRKRRFGGVKNA